MKINIFDPNSASYIFYFSRFSALACHKLNHFNSLGGDIKYPLRNFSNGILLRNYSKDLGPYPKYSISVGATSFSRNYREWTFFLIGVENFFIYWPGRHNLVPGRYFHQNYHPGKLPWHISPRHLHRVCWAAEPWICLVFFYGGGWWSKRFHCHMYFPRNNHFLH